MPPGHLRRRFPFSAVKGSEDAKKALECAAANDDLIGVLIKGPTGTAKSVLVRSFADVVRDKEIVNVPLNVTDEQLFGGLDIEEAIKFGKTTVKGGILQRADGNILYLDNVNLFESRMLSSLLECVESGKVMVEREGISSEYELRTTVLATMDPAEQALPDAVADRFDICVQTYSADEGSDRTDIIRSNLEFDADPEGFAARYSEDDARVLKRIEDAKKIISSVVLTRSDLRMIAKICIDLNVKGHRGDIAIAKVSKALAALDGRTAVSNEDIRDAAVLCLLHRRADVMKEKDTTQPEKIEAPVDEKVKEAAMSLPEGEQGKNEEDEEEIVETEEIGQTSLEFDEVENLGTVAEITGAVRERFEDMDELEAIRLRKIVGKAGKRKDITTNKRAGRYRGFRIPAGRTTDPAFDATVRAAAPHQRSRDSKGLSISIESQDIREKIRIKRDSCSFLFAVDVSGSLVKSGMMQDIKNGVKAMLMDNYVNRDKVALMTFRTGAVTISVPFTRSVAGITDVLENTECGDGTPLGPAMLVIKDYMLNYIRKNPDERCYVILITDGEATIPVQKGRDADMELRKVAAMMNIPNTEWMVVDSSLIPGKVNHAAELAAMLNARYIRLEDLQSA